MNRRNFFGLAAAAPFVPLIAAEATVTTTQVVTLKLDARALDAELAKKLPEILKGHAERTKNAAVEEVIKGIQRGKYDL